jgi:hypothetical protein
VWLDFRNDAEGPVVPRISKARQRHIDLGWKIIEWKLMYYRPEMVHPSWRADLTISDEDYDEAEQDYLYHCAKYKLPNTVVHKTYPGLEKIDYRHAMVEVDLSRPSVQLVVKKLGSPKGAK